MKGTGRVLVVAAFVLLAFGLLPLTLRGRRKPPTEANEEAQPTVTVRRLTPDEARDTPRSRLLDKLWGAALDDKKAWDRFPKVEFRFYCRTHSGRLEPLRCGFILIKPRGPTGGEITSLQYDAISPFGTGGAISIAPGGEEGGEIVQLGVVSADFQGVEKYLLIRGMHYEFTLRQYLVQGIYRRFGAGTGKYCFKLKIPELSEPAEVAVYEVVIPEPGTPPRKVVPSHQMVLGGTVTTRAGTPFPLHWVAEYYPPGGTSARVVQVDENGGFTIPVPRLGGTLFVGKVNETPRYVMWTVADRRVSLPGDADRAFPPDQAVKATFLLPASVDRQKVRQVRLFENPGDRFPMVRIGHSLKGVCWPGKYWVELGTSLQRRHLPQGTSEIWEAGWIEVTGDPSGNVFALPELKLKDPQLPTPLSEEAAGFVYPGVAF